MFSGGMNNDSDYKSSAALYPSWFITVDKELIDQWLEAWRGVLAFSHYWSLRNLKSPVSESSLKKFVVSVDDLPS